MLPFIGPDSGQNGENDVYHGQTDLKQPGDAGWPKKASKPKIITANMDVQVIQVAQAVETKEVPIKKIGQKAYKKRNGDQTGHNGVQQHTDLKIERLFAIVNDKVVLLFVRHPQDQGHDEVSEGDKVLRKRGRVYDRG